MHNRSLDFIDSYLESANVLIQKFREKGSLTQLEQVDGQQVPKKIPRIVIQEGEADHPEIERHVRTEEAGDIVVAPLRDQQPESGEHRPDVGLPAVPERVGGIGRPAGPPASSARCLSFCPGPSKKPEVAKCSSSVMVRIADLHAFFFAA